MPKTSIEWTDFSINPIRARNKETGAVGHYCEKISSGCKNCYASNLQKRFKMPAFNEQRQDDNIEVFLDESKLQEVLKREKPTKYFWCDMTDIFGDWVPDEFIDKCFAVMALTPQHTHQVLTKRAARLCACISRISKSIAPMESVARLFGYTFKFKGLYDGKEYSTLPFPFPNVWLGVSVENQNTADERIPYLLQTPAAVRFLSVEPMLGAVDLEPYMFGYRGNPEDGEEFYALPKSSQLLHWVICGGESGNSARPMHPDWVRDLRDQCQAADVPFFFKQWGSWLPYEYRKSMPPFYETPDGFLHDGHCLRIIDPETGEEAKGWDAGYWTIEEKLADCSFKNVGKRAAGRLLDKREWNEMPKVKK